MGDKFNIWTALFSILWLQNCIGTGVLAGLLPFYSQVSSSTLSNYGCICQQPLVHMHQGNCKSSPVSFNMTCACGIVKCLMTLCTTHFCQVHLNERKTIFWNMLQITCTTFHTCVLYIFSYLKEQHKYEMM